jgi:hypothetical protein
MSAWEEDLVRDGDGVLPSASVAADGSSTMLDSSTALGAHLKRFTAASLAVPPPPIMPSAVTARLCKHKSPLHPSLAAEATDK